MTSISEKKPTSIIKAYRGMVSYFLAGFKDIRSDAVGTPPRPLPSSKDNIESISDPQRKAENNYYTIEEVDDDKDEIHSRKSTPTTQKKQKTSKNNQKHNNKSKKNKSDFEIPPFNLKANRNFISISNSEHIHIGPNFVQNVNLNPNEQHQPTNKICKTPAVKALLVNDTQINREHLDVAATHIGHKWRLVGKGLNFTDGQLDQFELQNRGHPKEIIYQMLLAWTQEYPEDATLSKLGTIMWKTGEREAVIKLAEYIEEGG
uniref:Death domain-containing protein n=1 Tax=Clastoptera arizonana TaxID=38151 RepID=A0A1B6DYS2_9HEMI